MTVIAQDDHVTAGAWAAYEPFKTIHAPKIRRNVVEVSFRSRIRRKARNFVEFRRQVFVLILHNTVQCTTQADLEI